MPRHTLESHDQLWAWCDYHLQTKKRKYVLYLTKFNEIILEPQVSTDPIRYAYLQTREAERVSEEAVTKYNLVILNISSYDWDSRRTPGVRQYPS